MPLILIPLFNFQSHRVIDSDYATKEFKKYDWIFDELNTVNPEGDESQVYINFPSSQEISMYGILNRRKSLQVYLNPLPQKQFYENYFFDPLEYRDQFLRDYNFSSKNIKYVVVNECAEGIQSKNLTLVKKQNSVCIFQSKPKSL